MLNLYNSEVATSRANDYRDMLESYPFVVDTEERVCDCIRWQAERGLCEVEVEVHMTSDKADDLQEELEKIGYDVIVATISDDIYSMIIMWG